MKVICINDAHKRSQQLEQFLNACSQLLEHSLHQLLALSLLQPLGPNQHQLLEAVALVPVVPLVEVLLVHQDQPLEGSQHLHLVQLPRLPLAGALGDLVQLQQLLGKLQVHIQSAASPCA